MQIFSIEANYGITNAWPNACTVQQKAGQYRWQLLLQHPSRMTLQKALREYQQAELEKQPSAVNFGRRSARLIIKNAVKIHRTFISKIYLKSSTSPNRQAYFAVLGLDSKAILMPSSKEQTVAFPLFQAAIPKTIMKGTPLRLKALIVAPSF